MFGESLVWLVNFVVAVNKEVAASSAFDYSRKSQSIKILNQTSVLFNTLIYAEILITLIY